MTLSEELTWRGLLKDTSFADPNWLNQPQSFYLGIDASADSLTIGNLAIILLALRLARTGWQAFMVMGGGTSLVGDPGGKTEERRLMSRQTIEQNIAGVRSQVEQLFTNQPFTMVDNYDWLAELKYLDFIRDVGKHFSMTELMQRDFVADRMGENTSGISYTEFSYSLVQGYDFWHLFTKHGVVMQIGGSDQWGNMLSGVSLIRKKEAQEAHALSMPLIINKTTGVKFGKSEAGAVWLSAVKTSPTQFYQFWINCDDAGVADYLKVYTFLEQANIEQITAEHQQNPGARLAQIRLAEAVTTLVHGADAMRSAQLVTDYLTGKLPIGEADPVLAEIRSEIPTVTSSETGSLVDALVKTTLASSNGEARRLLADNAIAINGQKVTREKFVAGDFQHGRLLLRRGKAFKDTALVELT